MIARKKRTAQFRQYVAAETAVPVIACARVPARVGGEELRLRGRRALEERARPGRRHRPVGRRGATRDLQRPQRLIAPTPADSPNSHARSTSPSRSAAWSPSSTRAASRSRRATSNARASAALGTYAGKRQKTGPRRIGITVASRRRRSVIGRAPARSPSRASRSTSAAQAVGPACVRGGANARVYETLTAMAPKRRAPTSPR